jgi:hypothetical protein
LSHPLQHGQDGILLRDESQDHFPQESLIENLIPNDSRSSS